MESIANVLRDRINSGEFVSGKAWPSVRSLAKQYELGRHVIERGIAKLKKEGYLATNARRRLFAIQPQSSASIFQGFILEVLDRTSDRFFTNLISRDIQQGITLGAGDLKSPLLLIHGTHLRKTLPEGLLDQPIQGILLMGQFRAAILKAYARLGIPVVLCDRPAKIKGLHSVSVDNRAAAFDATRRMIERGHRRIAFLRFIAFSQSDVDQDSREREKGFLEAFRTEGLPRRDAVVIDTYSSDTLEQNSFQDRLQRKRAVSAVIAADAFQAHMVIQAARQMGWALPRDLSLACFQGMHPDLPNVSGPRVDFTAMGRKAIQLFTNPPHPHQNIVIPTVWHDGKTVAAPRKI